MENQANKIITERIQCEKESLIVGNSWVNLSGDNRKRYIELCRLQRKSITNQVTEKELLNVLD